MNSIILKNIKIYNMYTYIYKLIFSTSHKSKEIYLFQIVSLYLSFGCVIKFQEVSYSTMCMTGKKYKKKLDKSQRLTKA